MSFYIFNLAAENKSDTDESDAETDIQTNFKTKAFLGGSLFAMKRPILMSVRGIFERAFTVIPYAYITKAKGSMTFQTIEAAFIMGKSLMGTPTTTFKRKLEQPIPASVVGNKYCFEFQFYNKDFRFELTGFDHTFQTFGRRI